MWLGCLEIPLKSSASRVPAWVSSLLNAGQGRLALTFGAAPVLALPVGTEGAVRSLAAVGLAQVKAQKIGALGLLLLRLAATANKSGDFGDESHRSVVGNRDQSVCIRTRRKG